jgi:hypothetical protein
MLANRIPPKVVESAGSMNLREEWLVSGPSVD